MPLSESCHACDHEFRRRHERQRRETGVTNYENQTPVMQVCGTVGGWADLAQTCCLGPLALSRILSLRMLHAMHALTSIK